MGCPSMNQGIDGGARGLEAAFLNKQIPQWYSAGNFFGGKKLKKTKKTGSKKSRRKSYKKGGKKNLPGTVYEKKRTGGKKFKSRKKQKGGM